MSQKDTPSTGVCRSAPLARHVRFSIEVWSFQQNEQVRVVTRSLYICPLRGDESPYFGSPQPFARRKYFTKNIGFHATNEYENSIPCKAIQQS
jgi:hypothetical protein